MKNCAQLKRVAMIPIFLLIVLLMLPNAWAATLVVALLIRWSLVEILV